MRYLQVSEGWYLDYKTFKLTRNNLGMASDIPFYLWKHGKETQVVEYDAARRIGKLCHKTYTLKFNNMQIEFSESARKIKLSWLDKQGIVKCIEIEDEISVGVSYGALTRIMVDYDWVMPDGRRDSYYYIEYNVRERFKHVRGLNTPILPDDDNFIWLNWGMPAKQLDIKYYGKILGKSYVMLFGAWGILLGDDMTFDSVFVVSHTDAEQVGVSRFIYSVNALVIKTLFMQGRSYEGFSKSV